MADEKNKPVLVNPQAYMAHAASTMRAAGLRVTSARTVVTRILAHTSRPLLGSEISQQVEGLEGDTKGDRMTVSRILNALRDQELAIEAFGGWLPVPPTAKGEVSRETLAMRNVATGETSIVTLDPAFARSVRKGFGERIVQRITLNVEYIDPGQVPAEKESTDGEESS
jgi:hypothetical protein